MRSLFSQFLGVLVLLTVACGGCSGGSSSSGAGSTTTTALRGLAECTAVSGSAVICGTVYDTNGQTVSGATVALVVSRGVADEGACYSDTAGAFACQADDCSGDANFQITATGITNTILFTAECAVGSTTEVPVSSTTEESYPGDAECVGPEVGQSPNDSDNPFRALAVHPSNADIVMFGSEGNGFFRSLDGGTSWSRVNSGFMYTTSAVSCMYPEVYQMIFDHTDADRVYAATTPGPGFGGAGGFYYSTNGGGTWSRSVAGLHNFGVTSVAQDPSNKNVLYIGLDNEPTTDGSGTTNEGPNIYKSTDRGLNWTGIDLPVTDNRVIQIIVDPTDSQIIYCVGWDTDAGDVLSSSHLGFARSVDGGASWTRINTGLPSLNNPWLNMDKSNPSVLYTSVWTDQGVSSYKSTDSGTSWSQFPASESGIQLAQPKPSPVDSNTIIGYTTKYVYTTADGGTSWTEALDFSSLGIHFTDIEYTSSSDIVYGSANYLRVYRSTDGGLTFSAVTSPASLVGH